MSKDKDNFDAALAKWRQLHDEQVFGVAPKVGKIAVVCSYLTDYRSTGAELNMREIETFLIEAYAIKDQAAMLGRQAEIFEDADGDTMRHILSDVTISDVYTIGHGALPYLYMPNGTNVPPSYRFSELSYKQEATFNNRFDWLDVSDATTHLKQGVFIQRHCGHAIRSFSVPMGTFALKDQRMVIAPVADSFTPKNLQDNAENSKLVSVTATTPLLYDDIKRLFPKPDEDDEEPEPQPAQPQNRFARAAAFCLSISNLY